MRCVGRGKFHDYYVTINNEMAATRNLLRATYDQEKLQIIRPRASLKTPRRDDVLEYSDTSAKE